MTAVVPSPLLVVAHDGDRVAVGNEQLGWFDPGGDGDLTARVVAAAAQAEELRALIGAGSLPPVELGRRLAPSPTPVQVFGAPVNYHAHQGELGARSPSGDATTRELGLFVKAVGSVCGPDDAIELPALPGRESHYEGEVAVVISRGGGSIPAERALDHVAGLTAALDITLRLEAGKKEERSLRKSYRTFTPLGPALLPLSQVVSLPDVAVGLTLNGEPRQHGTLAQLICDVPELIAMASAVVDLRPGDVILTGTPAGVGPLRDGDEVAVSVSGLPPLRLPVRQAVAAGARA
ncbi:FAA hydrolase family protein [Jiangella ureilytica]|uniref:FAA hydrolase family protein n=1 Tax=Jiangella ureilytica TaxID=2530374 RepID=A0A4R4RP53_9ACTN|nr:fumarylacetoacetate hydrolase family protein [Jiangella ureilytica]TDC50919.1 FAA hydrolase family protein [Jiangella ureilytica]